MNSSVYSALLGCAIGSLLGHLLPFFGGPDPKAAAFQTAGVLLAAFAVWVTTRERKEKPE